MRKATPAEMIYMLRKGVVGKGGPGVNLVEVRGLAAAASQLNPSSELAACISKLPRLPTVPGSFVTENVAPYPVFACSQQGHEAPLQSNVTGWLWLQESQMNAEEVAQQGGQSPSVSPRCSSPDTWSSSTRSRFTGLCSLGLCACRMDKVLVNLTSGDVTLARIVDTDGTWLACV